ncbi:hypothetical protein [Amycolatopsis thailandensis]|uniref:hypothetical protein n=1 Tax=Amycolatopsis thailandensis TaxID=589330 RepID=UPI00362E25EC
MTNESNTSQSHGRALLWSILVISAVANATTSALGLSVYISIGFGLLTLISGIALVGHHRRERAGSRN